MALTTQFPKKTATVAVNGTITPHPKGVKYVIRVDGVTSTRTFKTGSPHEAAYSAAIRGMTQADADGVTHLTLQSPANLVIEQIEGTRNTIAPSLVSLKTDYELLERKFDSVDWVVGPA